MNLTPVLLQNGRIAVTWVRASILDPLARVFGRVFTLEPRAHEPCRIPAPVPVPVRRPGLLGASTIALLALSLALGASRPAAAWQREPSTFDLSTGGQLVTVQVLVDGEAASLYEAPGRWDRRYFQAFQGRNYALRLRNNTDRRVAVLIAVDGLNAVNGERSSLANSEPMYVLDPWQETTIRGWRSSLDEVRRFVFVDEQRSYAERTGQANGDMGWIRVLAFRESQPLRWFGQNQPGWRDHGGPEPLPFDQRGGEPEAQRAPASGEDKPGASSGKAARPDAEAPRAQANDELRQGYPGTGWGDRRYDPVHRVEFRPEARATDQLVLRYEYESGLRALGIFPEDGQRIWNRDRGELGFAKPPQW